MSAKKKRKTAKQIKTRTHVEEKLKNIPTAEYQSMVAKDEIDLLMVGVQVK